MPAFLLFLINKLELRDPVDILWIQNINENRIIKLNGG